MTSRLDAIEQRWIETDVRGDPYEDKPDVEDVLDLVAVARAAEQFVRDVETGAPHAEGRLVAALRPLLAEETT